MLSDRMQASPFGSSKTTSKDSDKSKLNLTGDVILVSIQRISCSLVIIAIFPGRASQLNRHHEDMELQECSGLMC